jgi:TonB-linked SusC/RagA family outer membrane protein
VDSTNWQKATFQQGITTDNHVTLTGGSDKVLYNFSAGLITQKAIVKDFDTKRVNVRMGLDETLGRFHFGQTLNFLYIHNTGMLANLNNALMMAPYKPILDPSIPGGYAIVSNIEDLSNVTNPLQRVNLTSQTTNMDVFYPQAFGEVSLIKGLKLRSQVSVKMGGSKYNEYDQPFTASNYLAQPRQALENYVDYANYTIENYLNYARKFGKHDINVTAGNSYIDPGHWSGLNAVGTNFANDNIQNIGIALSKAVTGASNGYASASMISYFGRIMYSFDNKYILSASVRRDGASVFGPDNRFGNFPGVGVGWNFSDETFIKNSMPAISMGKLRLSWGRTGNDNIPPFLTDANTFSGNPAGNLIYSLGTSETTVSGTTVVTIPNPYLKWETTDQTDIGLDLGFFKNKLTFSVDLYKRLNKDLLVNVPLPTSIGIGGTSVYTSSMMMNAATAENKGIELTMGYTNTIGKDLRLNLSANAAINKNNVISLGSQFTAPIRTGDFGYGSSIYTAPGSPIGSFYGYRVDHVAKDQAEIDALNASASAKTGGTVTTYQQGLLPGDFIWKDLSGKGYVDATDQEVLGNPMPKVMYGFSAGINYKNFDLNLVFAGVAGLKLLNETRNFTHFTGGTVMNASPDYLNRWRQPGDVAPYPRAGQDYSTNLLPSDFYIENGAFLRLRNITLGYTIPKNVIQSITSNVLSGVRFYIASENLLTITKYKGFDPEVSTQNNDYIFNRGIDNGQYPQPRAFLFGVQVNFQ